ncbi:hypothetical protein BgiMline_030220 [Biomphalaria glabrata]
MRLEQTLAVLMSHVIIRFYAVPRGNHWGPTVPIDPSAFMPFIRASCHDGRKIRALACYKTFNELKTPVSSHFQPGSLQQGHTSLDRKSASLVKCHTSSRSATVITSQRRQHQREMTKLFLLHRKEADLGTSFTWSGTRIERERHEVDNLQPDTEYQFIVMVVGEGGRCQLSEKLWLKTSAS